MSSNGVGVINTGSFPKRLWPGVKAWFGQAYNDYPTEYTEFMDVIKSDKMYEEFVSMGTLGLATVRDEGDATQYGSFAQGFTTRLVHVQYSTGFVITEILQADDQYAENLAKKGSIALARALRQTKETICANVLNNGFSVDATHVGGDGLALFSGSHIREDGGTFSNLMSSPVSLSEAGIEQALIDIGNLVDGAGLRIQIMAKKLIIPLALQFTAKRILGNPDRPATADRDINAIYAMGMLKEGYAVDHYLTSSSKWFIKTDAMDGLVLLERSGVQLTSDNDFDTDNAKFKVKERYIPSFVDPRGAYGVNI